MSGFTGRPINEEHARRMQVYLDKGYGVTGAWFSAQADMAQEQYQLVAVVVLNLCKTSVRRVGRSADLYVMVSTILYDIDPRFHILVSFPSIVTFVLTIGQVKHRKPPAAAGGFLLSDRR